MKKRILIIDDDAAVRHSLGKVLTRAGYEVILAADGRTGSAELAQQALDLLLLDLNLPDISGFDLLDLATQRVPPVTVIILTGLAEQCAPGSLEGAAALLDKPLDAALLLKTVEGLLTRPTAGGRPRPGPPAGNARLGRSPNRAVPRVSSRIAAFGRPVEMPRSVRAPGP